MSAPDLAAEMLRVVAQMSSYFVEHGFQPVAAKDLRQSLGLNDTKTARSICDAAAWMLGFQSVTRQSPQTYVHRLWQQAATPMSPKPEREARAKSAPEPQQTMQFIRLPKVLDLTGFGKSTLYRLVRAGHFPAPTRLSQRVSAWRQADVLRWLQEKQAA